MSNRRLHLFVISLMWLLCFGFNKIFAQPVFKKTKTISTENGLSQNSNDFIYQDRLGFIWLSSWEGLNRFDGKAVRSYKPVDLLSNSIAGKIIQTPFFEDPAGDIWFGTENAINCYRRNRDNFDHYCVNAGTLLASNPHRAVFLERGRFLWVNADSSLYRFDIQTKQSKRIQDLESLNYAVDTLKNGYLHRIFACHWLLRNGFEMITFDSAQQRLSNQSFFTDAKSGLQVIQAQVESISEVWFSTNRGILKFNPKYPSEYSLFPYPNAIKNITTLNDSIFLVADTKGNFLLFNKITKKYGQELSFENESGERIKFAKVNSTYFKDDIIWLSLLDKGVQFFSLTENAFERKRIPAAHNKQPIRQIVESPGGQVKTVSKDGVVMQYLGSNPPVEVYNGEEINNFYEDTKQGQYWIVSAYKTKLFSSKHQLIREFTNSDFNLNYAAAFWNEQVYIAGNQGLYRINKGGNSELLKDISTQITCLFVDQNQKLWIGSDKDLKICSILPDGGLKIIKAMENTGVVNQITQCPKTKKIWIASRDGLFTLGAPQDQIQKLVPTSKIGGASCYSIAVDLSGNVWLGTNSGLFKYYPTDDSIEKFTAAHGLKNTSFIMGAGFRQSNGFIWMGGENGVDLFDPENLYQRGRKPNVAITDLWVNGKPWGGSESIETAQKIELQYFENNLTFSFAALEYTNPADNFFKVKMDGIDPDWHYLEHVSNANYPNLPPGKYKFLVLAANAEGIWQTVPRTIILVIKPHFTATWWFRTLVVGFLIGIIGIGLAFFLLFRLRESQLSSEKQQRESEKKQMSLQQELALRDQRDQIAASIHDDLGAGLSNIRIASERALKKFSAELAQNTLSRITQLASELDENRRSLAWATDPEMDNLGSLVSRIRNDANKIFDQTGIQFAFYFPDNIPEINLPGPYRLHLLRAVKESLNNILRHAKATKTDIRMLITGNNTLVIFIIDNGIGFDLESGKGIGKGLRAIAKHLEATGGKIEWIKNKESGITIRMETPFPRQPSMVN